MTTIHAIVLAGGSGQRFGSDPPKQYGVVAGDTLLTWALRSYREADQVVVVHHPDYAAETKTSIAAAGVEGDVMLVVGGPTRRGSVLTAVAELDGLGVAGDVPVVLHNAVSPNTPAMLIERCVAALDTSPAVQAFIPARHTIFAHSDDRLIRLLTEDRLGYTCDPTVYRFRLLGRIGARMSENEGDLGETTLDVARSLGATVRLIESPEDNIKVTTAADLVMVEALLEQRRADNQR